MPLVNYPEFQEESLRIGQQHSIIRVKNLSSNVRVGVDVWGRTEGGKVNKFQPVQISVSIALKTPFETAASSDTVDGSTVNYGILSKAILKVLAFRAEELRSSDRKENEGFLRCMENDWTLTILLDVICCWLTGQLVDGNYYERLPGLEMAYKVNLKGLTKAMGRSTPAIVNMDSVHELEFSCFLPKGSILGTGVSLRMLTIPSPVGPGPARFCSILKLHDIHIPTLIGVNDNERLAKQMVIANVEIDGYLHYDVDSYPRLEQIVVKTIEESSFDTLETLGTHLVKRIIKWYLYAQHDPEDLDFLNKQIVKVSLEKPSAVMFAESPVVEVRRNADPKLSKQLHDQILELSRRATQTVATAASVPFPLQGRLDEWIRENDPFDTTGCEKEVQAKSI